MTFDFAALTGRERYKLLSHLVVPRPIALVTTVSRAGVHNAAPYSFFNVLAEDPPVLALGIGGGNGEGSGPKDTTQNIRDVGEFTVNLVDEGLLAKMSVCAIDFPAHVSELDEAGLTPLPSTKVASARIAESPVHMECRELLSLGLGGSRRTIVIGEVVQLHVRDDLVDPDDLHVDQARLNLVGRMRGGGWYVRTGEMLHQPDLTRADWEGRDDAD